MNDLFRFLMLRPARVTPREDVKILFRPVDWGATVEDARVAARDFVTKGSLTQIPDELAYTSAALAVTSAIGAGSLSARDVSAIVGRETGKTTAEVIGDPRFDTDEKRLAASLVAMNLLSHSSGGDGPGLAKLARGYDAIRLAAAGRDPVRLRVLSLPNFAKGSLSHELPPKTNPPAKSPPPKDFGSLRKSIRDLEAAIGTLMTLPASGFHVEEVSLGDDEPAPITRLDSKLAAPLTAEESGQDSGLVSSRSTMTRAWMLSQKAIAAIPSDVQSTISKAGIDLRVQSLPAILEMLHEERTREMIHLAEATMPERVSVHRLGFSFTESAADDYVGSPTAALPTRAGTIRPIGVGDLMLVKQHVLRYEGGELAHVENVLKTEHLSRETRRLERTETTIVRETETTKEEQRDTQTTDRFSLKRETSDTIKSDASFKAGVSVDATYGPFIEVRSNADFATSTSIESATRQASEFSKDIVARSASKLVERVLERRSVTTISEFEEKYSHGFDNTRGDGHVSGYYQWIDKVMQAQVYNYGKRLLFDVVVPEPGTNFILAQTNAEDPARSLEKPLPFTLRADEINEGNYRIWGSEYDVTGLEPPPPPDKLISKAYDAVVSPSPHESSRSDALPIDEGYRARWAALRASLIHGFRGRVFQLLIGSKLTDVEAISGHYDMDGEVGSLAFAYTAYQEEVLAVTVEVFCERTERAFAAWQLKTHDGITQGYLAKVQAYEEALAQARATAGTVIAGHNPLFNAQLVATELRKQCLTLVTGQQFDAFGALELSSEGYAQPNLAATESQMPFVRFFQHAFEWEHLIYFFYPYFWGWKPGWRNKMLLDDVDPLFGDFLRSGAARVVFPVRPGFEHAVIHYLETGEIWDGGPPPDISSSLYVPIVREIQEATGAPGDETPVGDPWLVRLPTTLVQLRPNNDLPTWEKVGEEWRPTN